MGVLTALAILAGLIVVHEAGHFFAATWQGIRVSGFSVGFGPVLLERRRRGVQFALRAIPLGGFVSFPDDDEDSPIPADDPNLLRNRPLTQRALVIAAGVLANLLLAWTVLVAQGLVVGIPAGYGASPGVLVAGVAPGQAADIAIYGLDRQPRYFGLHDPAIGPVTPTFAAPSADTTMLIGTAGAPAPAVSLGSFGWT
jgi:membrane-associated protease RseP (regulator of RpoE activity)